MSYQHQHKQSRRNAKKREKCNRKHQKQRSRMLASRHTKGLQTPPKPSKDLMEKIMNKDEVIESLAIFFYNSIQKNEKSWRRCTPVQTAPSIFSSTDFHATTPTIPQIRELIETIFEKRRLAAESGVVALVLFSRAGVKINSSNWMRLILVILLLANKEAEDVYSVWNVRFVGIIPNVPVYEINLLELEFLKYLKYRLHVERPTYQKFYKKLVVLLPEKTSEEKVEKSAEDDAEEFDESMQNEESEEPLEEPLEENENLEISDEELTHTSDDELQKFEEIKISDHTYPHDLNDCHEMSHDESIA